MLLWGTAAFAILAPLPLWINSLSLLIAVRFLTGLALGAMVVASIGLLGDYFSGARKAFWLSVQGSLPAAAAILGSIISGVLGQHGWRTPFIILLVGFPLLFALILVRQPNISNSSELQGNAVSERDEFHSWISLAGIMLITVAASLMMFAPAFEFGYLLQERGSASTILVGTMTAILGAGAMIGALLLPVLTRLPPLGQIGLCFLASCIGQFIVASSAGSVGLFVGAAVCGLAQGGTVPALSMWLLSSVPSESRGRAVSVFQTILYITQFAAPHLARFASLSIASTTLTMKSYALAAGGTAIALIILIIALHRSDS